MAFINKNTAPSEQKKRFIVQLFFASLTIWIGVQFYLFVNWLNSGGTTTFVERPPGVEAFLPISSLMNLYYFILTGHINHVHPAGLFIFIAILAISFIFGKSFCSWVCPIGFISELIGDFGEKIEKKIFKKKIVLPKILDYPLRSIKYLILAFFAYSIFSMSANALNSFLNSPYNMMVDVKLYNFFAHISLFSLTVITVIFVLSVFIRNFWCRYLCPYGALLGIFSLLSPNKIKRNSTSCINCDLCTKACPSHINVAKVSTVISDECTTCLSCVDACPVENTLDVKPVFTKTQKVDKKYIGFVILIIYFFITSIGVISNNWQNNKSKSVYLHLYKKLETIEHGTRSVSFDVTK